MTRGETWFGHPRGLTVLFLTNMWEQFSYFGMRALLMYYMTKQLLIAQGSASLIYGAYTAGAYLTPIVGGVIADRLLGKRRAVIIGASIMAAGHFMMTFEDLLFFALATIAIGNGLFLPSLPSQINDLYAKDDPARGRAYNIYYVGINLGGLLAPLVCGTLGELYGWHYGFGAAGIGMVAGLIIYLFGQHHLPEQGARSGNALEPTDTHFPRATVMALSGVALSVVVFRGAYEQAGNSIALWADSGLDRAVGSFVIPMTWFQSLNPLLVMMMTPLLLAYWARRGGLEAPARRMAIGAAIVAAAFLLIAAVAGVYGDARAPWPWLALFFASYTLGEIFILPTGLGLFARMAPPRLGATTVASWFATIFAGSLFAGAVGSLWSRLPPWTFFLVMAGLAGVAATLLLGADRLVRRANPPAPERVETALTPVE